MIGRARLPALDAALARFDGWWGGLSQRERWLIGTLAVLLAGVVLIYGIVKPIQAARAEARADIRQYETLNARMRAAGTLSSAPPPQQRTGTPVEIVGASASAIALVATPEALSDGVRVQIADAPFDAVTGWIADVERSSTLRTRKVEIERLPAAGRVRSVVEFGS